MRTALLPVTLLTYHFIDLPLFFLYLDPSFTFSFTQEQRKVKKLLNGLIYLILFTSYYFAYHFIDLLLFCFFLVSRSFLYLFPLFTCRSWQILNAVVYFILFTPFFPQFSFLHTNRKRATTTTKNNGLKIYKHRPASVFSCLFSVFYCTFFFI